VSLPARTLLITASWLPLNEENPKYSRNFSCNNTPCSVSIIYRCQQNLPKYNIFFCKNVITLQKTYKKNYDTKMRLYTSELVKSYKSRTVVNHVTIDVNQGEIVGLLGPNGAGKTTTFYMIVGLIKPNEGRIFLENDEGIVTDITKLPVYRRAQMGVGYLAQEASVFRHLTVEDNIRAVLEMTNYSKEYQRERVENLIEEFRLAKVRKSYGNQLSGGERRRTEIARAVAINPSFILLDEPFAGVDPIAVEDIQSIVGTLKDKNIGVIITDHNVDETLAITDRTYLLYEGKILKTGTAEDLANDEMVRKVYLGSNFELRTSPQMARQRKEREEKEREEALRALGHVSHSDEDDDL
jgi:lipopolysaccharide export system ATP-binding protein